MRIIGLLSWYDESPLWLSATITSAAPHIDHLIAVDGAYALYPDGHAMSRSDQACAIVETCQAAGIGLTLHRPRERWYGNEVEKRNRMFRLGEIEADAYEDWYMVLDADEIVHTCPPDLRHMLNATEHDAADVTFWERGDPYRNPARLEHETTTALPPDSRFKVPILFRAVPGLHCDGAHYVYRTPDGRYLWGAPCADEPPYDRHAEPRLDLAGLFVIEHRTHYRPKQRHLDAQDYYKRREAAGVEKLPTPTVPSA